MRQKTTNGLLVLGGILLAGTLWAGQRYLRSEPVTGEPVVNDAVTGLMWQGCSAGQRGSSCATGSASTHRWSEALAYCQQLDWGGHSDWRLPNIRELHSITDKRRFDPAIDSTAFPATPSDNFWSSTTTVWSNSRAWNVNFLNGDDDSYIKPSFVDVRCVRPGP